MIISSAQISPVVDVGIQESDNRIVPVKTSSTSKVQGGHATKVGHARCKTDFITGRRSNEVAAKAETGVVPTAMRGTARARVRRKHAASPIVLVDDFDTDEFPYQGLQREQELLKDLRDLKQTPKPGPFSKDDIGWLPIQTQSAGQYFHHEIAVIPWSRLEDFRTGEGMDKMFPCRFTKETLKKRLPGSLSTPRANSASKVIR